MTFENQVHRNAHEAYEMALDRLPTLEGVVVEIDQARTTAFIESNGKRYLAFRLPKNPLQLADRIRFTPDGRRAVRIEVLK